MCIYTSVCCSLIRLAGFPELIGLPRFTQKQRLKRKKGDKSLPQTQGEAILHLSSMSDLSKLHFQKLSCSADRISGLI